MYFVTKYLSCLLCQPGNNKCEHAQYKDLKRGAYHSEKSGTAMAVPSSTALNMLQGFYAYQNVLPEQVTISQYS